MKVVDAKFTRRFVIADYEHEEYTLSAQVEGKETGAQVLTALKEEVLAAYSGEEKETKPAKAAKETKEKKNGTKPKTSPVDDENTDDEDSTDEDAGTDGEGDQDDEAADGEDGDDGDDSSDDSEGDEGEDGEDDEAKAPVKGKAASAGKGSKAAEKEAPKKAFRKKPQSYNRGIEQHKEIFSGLLRTVAPDWKKSDATKAKAKKASEVMEGKEFLDENGEVLATFKAEVKKLMAVKK